MLAELLTSSGYVLKSDRLWSFRAPRFASFVETTDLDEPSPRVTSMVMRIPRGRILTVSYILDIDGYLPPGGDEEAASKRLDMDARAAIRALGEGEVRARRHERAIELLVPRSDDWIVTGPRRYSEGALSEVSAPDFVDVRLLESTF